MYLLDTNVVSELRRNRPHCAVLEWLHNVANTALYLSAVTIGEIQSGVEGLRGRDMAKATEIEKWLEAVATTYNVVPIDAVAFRCWARITHGLPDSLAMDGMIAATELTHGLIVATRNITDFKHFRVQTLNPFAPV